MHGGQKQMRLLIEPTYYVDTVKKLLCIDSRNANGHGSMKESLI
jgi:hypothetical protein